MRDTTQKLPVTCDVHPCLVRDLADPKKVTQAPAVIEVDRQSEAHVVFSADSRQKKQILVGRVRWGESVLPNALLGVVGPTGWALAAAGFITDFLTGSMYELPTPRPVKFRDEAIKHNPERIVIAPVRAENQLESDQAVVYVLEALRKRYPKAEIQVPEQYWRQFERAGWSSSEYPTEGWKLYDLYSDLNTPYVALATVTTTSERQREVTFAVNDVYRKEVISKDKAEYQSQYSKGETMAWAKGKMVDLIPNAVSLSSVNSTASGFAMAVDQDTSVAANSTKFATKTFSISGSPERGKTRSDWAVSVANFDPDLGRRFSLVFRWATDGTIGKSSTYIFEDYYSYDYQTFDRKESESLRARVYQYYLGAGIGPEFGIAGFLGYLYTNVLVGAEVMYSDISGSENDLWEVYSPYSVNLGHKFRIAENFQFGWGLNFKVIPEWVNSKVLSAGAGEKVNGSMGGEMRAIVGITYLFPEMKTLGRSQVRKLVTN